MAQIEDAMLRHELSRSVDKASDKTDGQLRIASYFYNNIAENMRQWSVIKRYHDMINDGLINPPDKFANYYDQYDYMTQQILTVDDLEELIEQAETQSKIREERLNRKAKKLTEKTTATFEEGARMLGLFDQR